MPSLAEPISELMTAALHAHSVSHTETTEAVFIVEREREAFYVGALTNVAAGERVVIFVIRNCLVPVALLLWNTTERVSDIEWHLMSAISTIISVSPSWRKVFKLIRQTEVRCANGEIGDRQR